ncbi:hypothetical protein [Methylobacterium sp. A54F]
MRIATLTAALLLTLGSTAATTPAGAMPAGSAIAVAGTSDIITTVRKKRSSRRVGAVRGQAGGFRNVTRGAIGGDSGGNAVTGSNAAPSGK